MKTLLRKLLLKLLTPTERELIANPPRRLHAHEVEILAASAEKSGAALTLLKQGFVPTPEEQEILRAACGRADPVKVLKEGVLLTPEQKILLNAERATVLQAMLSPEQWRILEALEKPDTFLADVTFEESEAAALESFFKSPLWAKNDVAIINWLQQQAQAAIRATPDQMVAAGKFAYGCRAGFEMTKSISRLAAAKRSEPEDSDAPTAAAGLEQHQP